MAVTVARVNTAVPLSTQTWIGTIIATADGDTTATITHGLSATPTDVQITQTISQALTALSAWAVTTISSTQVVLTKLTSTGSGNASVQLQVRISLPNTLVS
jgi:hypothetical protein